MQVILLKDVDRVGHEGDVVKVADGHARNYLIPQGLAVLATRGTLKDLEQRRGIIERRDAEKREIAQSMADGLRDKTVVVKAVTGEGSRLHGSVTSSQIAQAASEQLEISLDRRDIEILEPIRELGDYLVSARVYKDVVAQMPVHVISDKKADAAALQAEADAEAAFAEIEAEAALAKAEADAAFAEADAEAAAKAAAEAELALEETVEEEASDEEEPDEEPEQG